MPCASVCKSRGRVPQQQLLLRERMLQCRSRNHTTQRHQQHTNGPLSLAHLSHAVAVTSATGETHSSSHRSRSKTAAGTTTAAAAARARARRATAAGGVRPLSIALCHSNAAHIHPTQPGTSRSHSHGNVVAVAYGSWRALRARVESLRRPRRHRTRQRSACPMSSAVTRAARGADGSVRQRRRRPTAAVH